jgi:cell wall-associated NlpC family hydrolase
VPALRPAAILLIAVLATACAPFRPETRPAGGAGMPEPASRIVQAAIAQVGAPYRYGGADPSGGFDCSGLVSWVFRQQGIAVPRTAAQQFAAARPVAASSLRPGDLVFFRLSSPTGEVSHVGIYAGQDQFVHAPQSGRRVGLASLEDEFYRTRLAGYGRFDTDAQRHAAPR